MSALPRLHLLEEVAETYRLSLRSLSEQARKAKFEHIRYGNRRYLTDAQIAALLEQHTVRPAEVDELAETKARVARRASTKRPRQKLAA